MFRRSFLPLLLALITTAPAYAGLDSDVTFTLPAPLAAPEELARRTLSPLDALRLHDRVMATPPIDLEAERFVLYVPEAAPAEGYGLLVFVSPSAKARLPSHWSTALDRHGVIFVGATRSGNDANTFERREPLALIAARNVMARYRVDASRVYVGGFSGGSRVALRLALAYPDLFRGALLEAGSDPISPTMPPPPADLFRQFQAASRLVYLTGARDEFHIAEDRHSQQSIQDWCVFDLATETLPWSDHELADSAGFELGLAALSHPEPPDPAKLVACRDRIDRAMAADFARVDTWPSLAQFDARYGGLAAVRSLEMARKLSAPQ